MTSELEDLWRVTLDTLPTGFELRGVVYHGPDHDGPWIAFAEHTGGDGSETCEGIGQSPGEALASLRQHISSEHASSN